MHRQIATSGRAKGRGTSASGFKRALGVAMEGLELRRLLSADYALEHTITNAAGAELDGFSGFAAVSADGSRAVITAPSKSAETYTGEAYLIDTTDGAILHTFARPYAQQFGQRATFIGNDKLAISDPGSVYVYDLTTPSAEPVSLSGINTTFGLALASDGTDLFVSMPMTFTPDFEVGPGRIYQYEYDSNGWSVADEYVNDTGGAPNALGQVLAVSNGTLYASACDNSNPSYPQQRILTFDTTTGDLAATVFSDPEAPAAWEPERVFAQSFDVALAPNGDVFVGTADPLTGGIVYQFNSAGIMEDKYVSPAPGTFGAWIDVNDQNQLIVGAATTQGDDALQTGAAYVFDTAVGDPDPIATINRPDGAATDDYGSFGTIVTSLPNGRFLITDPAANTAQGIDAGAAYIFEPGTTTPTNTAPTIDSLTGPSASLRQQSVAFSGSFLDPDAGDSHLVSWDFGDGTVIGSHSTTDPGALDPAHTYTTSGVYTVTMTISDSQGATATSAVAVTVTATGMQNGRFYVGGTDGNDTIVVSAENHLAPVSVTVDGVTETVPAGATIVVIGGEGDDVLNVGFNVGVSTYVNGGAGNDTISGGSASDILVGGDGNDTIDGRASGDLLIGGAGNDNLVGFTDDDILVGGSTSYDLDLTALSAIMAEWTSSHAYADRVANIRDGSGAVPELNGTYFLTPDVTVFDDAASDTLTGSAGTDWFIVNVDGNQVDQIVDLKKKEDATDVDPSAP